MSVKSNDIFSIIDKLQELWEKSIETVKEDSAAQKLIEDTSFAKYKKTLDSSQNNLITNDVIIKHDYNNIVKIESLIEKNKDNINLKKSLENFLTAYQKTHKICDLIEGYLIGTLESWTRIRKTVEFLDTKTMELFKEKLPLRDLFSRQGPTEEQQRALYTLTMINSAFREYLDLNNYLNVDMPNLGNDEIVNRKKVAYFDRDIANYQKLYLRQCKRVVSVLSDNETAKSAAEDHLKEVEKLFKASDKTTKDPYNNETEQEILDIVSEKNNTKFLVELLNNKFQSETNSESYYRYIDFKMKDNDLTLDAEGNIDFCFDYDCMRQNIAQALKALQGEYDFNINIGIDYKQILGERADVAVLTNQIKKQLNAIKHIEYTKIELLTAAKRIVEANVKCQTPFGEVNVTTN